MLTDLNYEIKIRNILTQCLLPKKKELQKIKKKKLENFLIDLLRVK